MGSTGHLSVQQGKKVVVHLKDGDKMIGKFYERKSKFVKITRGPIMFLIPTKNIRTISILK